jgi:hypothetical protein
MTFEKVVCVQIGKELQQHANKIMRYRIGLKNKKEKRQHEGGGSSYRFSFG